jgi:hypothetical protein
MVVSMLYQLFATMRQLDLRCQSCGVQTPNLPLTVLSCYQTADTVLYLPKTAFKVLNVDDSSFHCIAGELCKVSN